jgi:hypothetical protein
MPSTQDAASDLLRMPVLRQIRAHLRCPMRKLASPCGVHLQEVPRGFETFRCSEREVRRELPAFTVSKPHRLEAPAEPGKKEEAGTSPARTGAKTRTESLRGEARSETRIRPARFPNVTRRSIQVAGFRRPGCGGASRPNRKRAPR